MKKQSKPEEKENCQRLLRNAVEKSFARSPSAYLEMKEKNPRDLLQELRVHQIELEMQNEELRKARLALEESRQRYADLYDFAPVGYFTFTSEALIKEANLTVATLLGVARQKLISARFRRMVAAKDQDRWDQHFLKVLQQGEKQTCDLTLKRQDGSTFQAGLESIRLEVSRGAFEVHTTVTDITERKRTEEELRRSEEKFSSLFDNAAGGVFQSTPEGRLIIVNRVFARIFGYESSEEVINTMTDITRQIYANPDNRKMINGMLKEKGYLRNCECQMLRKDGSIFWGSISGRLAETVDNIPCIEGLIIDVSERKQAEEELRESEKRYRDLYDFLPIPVYEMDFEANIISANRAIYETFGGTEEDLKKDFKAWQLISPEEIEKSSKNIQRLLKGEQVEGTEYTLMRLDGSAFPAIIVASLFYSDGKPVGIRGAVVDITERKRAEEKLQESEELFKSYLEHAPDGVYMSDPEGTFLYGNRKCEEIIGYRREELIGKNFLELNILSENSLNKAIQLLQANTEGRATGPDEIELINKEGRLIPVEINTNVVQRMGQRIVIASVRDITNRKRAEEELRESEEKYRNILENIEDGYFEIDLAGNFTFFNPSLCRIVGYPREEMLGMNNRVFMDAENAKKVFRTFNKAYVTGIPTKGFEWETIRKDGTRVNIEVSLSLIVRPGEKPTGFRGIARDVTERKQGEDAIRVSEEKYRLVVENAKEAIIVTQDVKLVFVNRAAVDMTGYSEEILTSKSFTDFIHPDDHNMVVDHHIRRLKGEEVPSVYSFRVLRQDGTVTWAELNAVVIQWKGRPATLNFLNNITERKRAEEELQRTLESLRKSFGATIQAMVSAIESRDPYTAGHQTRSADLARAIATEMGLPHEKIDGIRVAGSIHDIGKLSIPAEILSKPSKLTNLEFSLIKEHSQKGYEMLKGVESPWPLAQIVYQHHERMDGSGYPQGLKGEDILLESRILMVADVVEAMASHRPYRPALGIDAALEEIEKNKGILYDDKVVEVCLRLFREKGFGFK